MTVQTNEGPAYFFVEEHAWADEQDGARRMFLARGEGGFYSQYSVMPAGYTVPLHRHDHDELIVVLAGGCTLLGGGPTLKAHDSMVLPAGYEYGFTCTAEGMAFVTIRTGASSTTYSG